MDMITHGTLNEIKTELKRIADAIEQGNQLSTPLKRINRSEAGFIMREAATLEGPEGSRLAEMLADAIENDPSTDTRAVVIKHATTMFANAQDTSDKLAEAFGELAKLRRKSNSDFLHGMKKIRELVRLDCEKRTVEFPGKDGAAVRIVPDLLKNIDQLIELNTAQSDSIELTGDEVNGILAQSV